MRTRAARAARRRSAGLTLIEVLMGTLVVSLVVVSASWAVSQASTSKHVHEESPIIAALLAKEIHELALTLPTAASGLGAAAAADEVVALESLDGASFSPPIDSELQEFPGNQGWIQTTSVSVYDLSDLETPTSTTFTSATKASAALFKLSVQITNGNQDMGTWWWWINP